MFFVAFFGIEDKENHIGTYNNAVCPACGSLARYDVYKSYRYLHVFFIPTFKWNVRYFVKTSCCGNFYELDPAVGSEFERNPNTVIRNENLRPVSFYSPYKYCQNCKADVPAEFNYCPYCGGKL
ncbi:MAG: zinc ribbon domain-containing protein [Oscillospiraceae bacterium]|jgi:RNA polymerase subunit RPABC4/transcription elongation factor Spt4